MTRTQAARLEDALRKLGFQANVTGAARNSLDIEEAIDLLEWAAARK